MVCERPPAAFGGSPPREGETRAERARGALRHHLELQLSNTLLQPWLHSAPLRGWNSARKPPARHVMLGAPECFERGLELQTDLTCEGSVTGLGLDFTEGSGIDIQVGITRRGV